MNVSLVNPPGTHSWNSLIRCDPNEQSSKDRDDKPPMGSNRPLQLAGGYRTGDLRMGAVSHTDDTTGEMYLQIWSFRDAGIGLGSWKIHPFMDIHMAMGQY